MNNFIKKGSLIKLMRWMSFFEVACEWRGDLFATKLILESDAGGKDDVSTPADLPKPLQESQGQCQEKQKGKLDAKKEIADLKKAHGVWTLAPRMITTKNVATLDYLLLVAKATWQLHAEKARALVSPIQVLEHNVAACSGQYWAHELEQMVAHSLWDKKELLSMYPLDSCQNDDQILLEHVAFFDNLLNTRAVSFSAAYCLPPMRWNGVLHPDPLLANACRGKLLEEWGLLLRMEAASLHTKGKVIPLEKMYWRLGTYCRVLCMAHERDSAKGLSCQSGSAFPLQMLLAKNLGDSRVIEVAHQQGPDLQRTSRKNTLPDVSVMYGTLSSGALEQRKVDLIKVEPSEVIYSNASKLGSIKQTLNPSSHKLDAGLQRMMQRRQGKNHWPSPAPASLFPSLAATEWLMSFLKGEHPGSSVDSAWISCLGGMPGDLVAHQPSSSLLRVVAVAEYGLLLWTMDTATDGDNSSVRYIMRPDRQLLHWRHITNINDWVHVPARPVLSSAGRIEWEKTGQCLPLVLACIQNGLQLNVAQMRKLLKHFQVAVPPNLNKASLQQFLVSTFLDKDEDQKKAMQHFEAASKDDILDSDLEDLVSCLDDEDANPLDLKELKEKKRLKRYQKHGKAAAAGRQQVPDRQKKKGKGKGRGRGGKGKGRRGRPTVRKNFVKKNGKGNPPAPAQPDSLPNAPGDADSEVPSPSPPPCDHPAPADTSEVDTLPPSSPEQVPLHGDQLAHPGTLPSSSLGEVPSHHGEVPSPHGEVPSPHGEVPSPHADQIVEPGTLPEGLTQEVLPAPDDHPLPDGAQPSLPAAAPATPVPLQAPQPASCSSGRPGAPGVARPKVYSTPQEAFEDMIPPGAKMVLNHNEHRFCTSWVGSSEGVPQNWLQSTLQDPLSTSLMSRPLQSVMKDFGKNGVT